MSNPTTETTATTINDVHTLEQVVSALKEREAPIGLCEVLATNVPFGPIAEVRWHSYRSYLSRDASRQGLLGEVIRLEQVWRRLRAAA